MLRKDTFREDIGKGASWSELDEMLWPSDPLYKDRSERTGITYPQDFKDECVRMVVLLGMRPSEVAREMDCTPQSVSGWVRTYKKQKREENK